MLCRTQDHDRPLCIAFIAAGLAMNNTAPHPTTDEDEDEDISIAIECDEIIQQQVHRSAAPPTTPQARSISL